MRLKWVKERLERWVSWLYGEGLIKSHTPDGMPTAPANAASFVPKDCFEDKVTQFAFDRLCPEYQKVICQVYIVGPEKGVKTIPDIARACGQSKSTLYRNIEAAENRLAEIIDWLSMRPANLQMIRRAA